MPQYFLS